MALNQYAKSLFHTQTKQFQVSDVLDIHRKSCPNKHCKTVQLSLDGVTQSKSSSVSLEIYSTSFTKCRVVYPLNVFWPINRLPVGYHKYLSKIVQDLHTANCVIRHFIADNPKHTLVQEALNHASHYACEYCTAKAGRARIAPIKESGQEVKGVMDAVQIFQEMSGTSTMAQRKNQHLQSLQELKKNEIQRIHDTSHGPAPQPRASSGQIQIRKQ